MVHNYVRQFGSTFFFALILRVGPSQARAENLPADEAAKLLHLTKLLHSGKTDKALRAAVCKQPSKQVRLIIGACM